MTPTLIVVVNEIGREKTDYLKGDVFYNAFNLNVKTYPAPNIPDGEHRAYLQWQWQNPYTPNKRWEDEPNEANHEHSMSHGYKTQQIWKLSEEQQPEGETAKQAAQKFTEQDSIYEVWNKIDVQDAFVEGAEWQRKQPVGWISVQKQLPEYRKQVLLRATHSKEIVIGYLTMDNNKQDVWKADIFYSKGLVSHWMEIPEHPTT